MIQQRLETGRYSDASEVVREALRLLEERTVRRSWHTCAVCCR
jgi:putative addiction module CopG family antidote